MANGSKIATAAATAFVLPIVFIVAGGAVADLFGSNCTTTGASTPTATASARSSNDPQGWGTPRSSWTPPTPAPSSTATSSMCPAGNR